MDTARNGQIIVARVGEEVTVKRYQKNRNHITLLPENKDYQPIEVDLKETEFAVEGLYVGVVRRG
jgi:repressor LexA